MTSKAQRIKAKLRAGKTLTVIRWEFTRGQERMACQVNRAAEGHDADTFAVIELPYQRLQRATIEIFQSATAALRRHAALAADLRATGWKLVAYTELIMTTPLMSIPQDGIEAGPLHLASLLGELCLRAAGISLAIAAVITICLALAGGASWANTS